MPKTSGFICLISNDYGVFSLSLNQRLADYEIDDMNELLDKMLANSGLEERLADEIRTAGRLKKVKAGELIFGSDQGGGEMPIVLQGLLKVMRQDEQRNEVFLYYLEGGETCAMSIACCLEGRNTGFHVMAEEDSIVWMIPNSYLDAWMVKYLSFRKFVFSSYQTRFDELLTTIDSVVFHNMDERLLKYLLDTQQATGTFKIQKTHQQIANELNTSRVVVSRLLKGLEADGKIELHRNCIEIL
ncbi:Crp/Fnr family transcriptional regulator [Roseivirga seohaensis]|uniref:Crp/Fnr family transcriptional regulator n=1 Tax=Roseivirga seohaensis TaxID=1914963 RepID=UPI003BAC1152